MKKLFLLLLSAGFLLAGEITLKCYTYAKVNMQTHKKTYLSGDFDIKAIVTPKKITIPLSKNKEVVFDFVKTYKDGNIKYENKNIGIILLDGESFKTKDKGIFIALKINNSKYIYIDKCNKVK
jgi:hypothetical protein